MIITTTELLPNHEFVTLDTVFGVTTQSRSALGNFGANLKATFGGEIKQYTKMVEHSREQALQRMCENAKDIGADAIVMMRFDSGSISDDMISVVAYGTAVKFI